MIANIAVAAVAAFPLLADAAPLRASRRTMPVKRATWNLAQDYSGSGFLDGWSVFTADDPTHGMVDYVQDSSLQYYDSGSNTTILKVDSTSNLAPGEFRRSSRITSNAVVNEGSLVIGDFAHAPYGCATWPAFWLVGPDWPSGGEVDIFENVNRATANGMVLHTSPGCNHDNNVEETGTPGQVECDTNVNGNTGCGVTDNSGVSYGDALNNNGGGVWATLWDAGGISIWFFPRNSVPGDINSNAPTPENWGTPSAHWTFTTGQCNSGFFHDLQAVFDITLCGDWAGQDVIYQQTCQGVCSDAVQTGSNFNDAYFSVNKVQFYTAS